MAANVKLFRLTNGEEVLAELIEDKTTLNVRFKNPVRVVIVPSKTDPKIPTVALAPWAEFVDEKEFSLDKSHVMFIMTPVQEFVNQYNSIFGGIVMPSSKLILPEG